MGLTNRQPPLASRSAPVGDVARSGALDGLSGSVLRVVALVVVALCAWTTSATAQEHGDDDEPRVLCAHCENSGRLECKKHRGVLELERAVEFCSVAHECRRCEGVLETDCRICTNTPVEKNAEARRRLLKEWLAERQGMVAEHLEEAETTVHLRTEHVEIVCTLEPQKVGRKTYDTHRLAHLYAERLEQLHAAFCETLDVDPARGFPTLGNGSDRLRIHILEDREDYRTLVPQTTELGGREATSIKEMGVRSIFLVWHDPRTLRSDEQLNRNIVHNTTHLLLAAAEPIEWIGNRGHGWLDEGISHWFEDKFGDACTTFCYEEVGLDPGAGFANGRWRVAVRKLVEAGKLEPFIDVYRQNSDQLSLQAHAQAFAYVDFILAQDDGGRKLRQIVQRLKKKGTDARDVMPSILGIGPLQFDGAFSEWVRETYPIRERR